MPEWSAADRSWMSRALMLAERGLYTTEPNPRVGCVLVADGEVVGEGWHVRAGEGHAEVNALAQAGERARGATAYVTLEPCSHFGKTPPCADALIKAGVSRMVAAMQDPNPQVAGNGLQRLREAGIAVECGLLEEQARALNPGFIKRMQQGLPWVRVKLAMSLDGRTAMASGESKWITGP
ncbi:MAG TPA: bifunctional diaminohydroxyphosphoribosylaminopyrimidine deaminase/5-amino-6-(5-phosphoribosylamino)uracil reductase RibD, partial [Curvibacter sp.]|nr:bifunctional diaminohydroxyphosphoribosylaminopyrimidine deaminase/5-amino-6-(5-phosphoribosylamino)uracil reductase RibD [Curvibacter sp.]